MINNYSFPQLLDHNEIRLSDIDDVKYFNINPLLKPKRGNSFFLSIRNSHCIRYIVLNYNEEKDILKIAKNGDEYSFTLNDFYWILKSIPSESVIFKHYENDEHYYLKYGNLKLNVNV